MKEFILIVCKPALLSCLLGLSVLGCECLGDLPRTDDFTFILRNFSDQEIHIFLVKEGTGFDPKNKVEAREERSVTTECYFVDKDSFEEITVNAGRDGQVLDNKIYTLRPGITQRQDIKVTWDGYGLY